MTKSGALSDSGAPGNDMTPHFQRRCFRAHKARAFKPTFSPTPVLDFHLMRKIFVFANFLFRIMRYSADFTPAPPLVTKQSCSPGLDSRRFYWPIARLVAIICPQLQQAKTRFGAADEDFTFYSIGQNHPHCRSEPHICLAVRQRFTSSFPSVSRETHDFSV